MSLVLIDLDHFSGQRNIWPTPDAAERDLAKLIREIQTEINSIEAGIDHATRGHAQAVAATHTDVFMIAPAAGTIVAAQATAETAAAAGESMTLDVQIKGATALTAAITLDDTTGTDVVAGVVDTAANVFVAGDKISVVRTYVAGGAPTPMTDTLVDIGYRLA